MLSLLENTVVCIVTGGSCFVQTIWIDKKNVHVGKITVCNTYKDYKSVQKYLLKFKILLMKGMLLNFLEEPCMTFYPLKMGR
uniref:Uncharacterized protein n=1 Tax=Phasianus colchicus TaxID=9054 RepID=A0A669QWV3_PHACC